MRLPDRQQVLGTLRSVGLVLGVYVAMHLWQTHSLTTGPAPAFATTTLDGEALTLAQFRGKPLTIHFWATWCGVCSAMAHNVVALSSDVPVVSVASLSGSEQEIAAHVVDHGFKFPVIADPSGALAKRFGVNAFPTTFVIDADGNIRHSEVGYTTELGLRVRNWLAAW